MDTYTVTPEDLEPVMCMYWAVENASVRTWSRHENKRPPVGSRGDR